MDESEQQRGAGQTKSGRPRWRERLTRRIFAKEFQIEAALLALTHWDRLTAEEQQEFRSLGTRTNGDKPLDRAEQKRLNRLWRKLGTKALVTEVLRRARAKPSSDDRSVSDESETAPSR